MLSIGIEIRRSFMNIIEFQRSFIDPYETRLHSYLIHKYNFLRLEGIYLLSHPLIIYEPTNFPFISSAPFIYRHRDSVYAYNIIMDQHLLQPLKIVYSNHKAYLLNMFSTIITDSMNIPTNIFLGSPEKGLEMKTLDRINASVDIYSIGFNSYVFFFNEKHKLFRGVINSDIDLVEDKHCKAVLPLKYDHYKALICLDGNNSFAIVSDGIYGIEFKLDEEPFIPSDTSFYLYLNIAYIKLFDNGIIAYCIDNSCRTIKIPKHLRPLALLSNNSILGFTKKWLTLYLTDEKKEQNLISIDFENISNISIDPYKNLASLSINDDIYIFDLSNMIFVKIPFKKKLLSYISDNYIMLLGKNNVEIYFLDVGNNIHLEKIFTGSSNLIRCTAIGKGSAACIDRVGRIVFLNLGNIDSYIDENPYILRDGSTTTSIFIPDMIPYIPFRFEGHIEPLYNIYRIDSSRSIVDITIDQGSNMSYEFLLYVQGLLKEYKIPINIDKGVKIHSKKPSEVYLPKIYIINKNTSSYILPSFKSLERIIDRENLEDLIVIENNNVYKGYINKGIIKFDGDYKISAGNPIYIAKNVNDIVIGQVIKVLNIYQIDLDDIIKINKSFKNNSIEICIDDSLLENTDIVFSSIEVICTNKVLKSSAKCINIDSCEDILLILIEFTLNELKENSIVIPFQYNIKPYIELIKGYNIHFNTNPYIKIGIPYRCMYFNNTYIYYDNTFKVCADVVNKCNDILVYIITSNSLRYIRSNEALKIEYPINLNNIVKGYTSFMVIEPSGVKMIYIDTKLRDVILYAHRIALKLATFLGIRKSVQKHSYSSSTA